MLRVETSISRLFWMWLALGPLWPSRQEVSWPAAPGSQSVPVVRNCRGRRKSAGVSSWKWNMSRKWLCHVLEGCFSTSSCSFDLFHITCSAHSFSPLVLCVFFPYLLLCHLSSCTWAHIPLLGHQVAEGYHPSLHSHHLWPLGRVTIPSQTMYDCIMETIIVTCNSNSKKLHIFWPWYTENT